MNGANALSMASILVLAAMLTPTFKVQRPKPDCISCKMFAAASALLNIFCLSFLGVPPFPASPSGNAAQIDYFPSSELIVFTASPDGRWIAAYAADRKLPLWEAGTGQRRELMSDYRISLGADALEFAPNSSYLVVGDANGLIQLLQIPAGTVLRKMQDRDSVEQFAFSADGSQLAALHHKGITIWNMKIGAESRYLPEESPFTAMALNRDGSLLVTGSEDGKIRILDLSRSRQIAKIDLEPKDWANFLAIDEGNEKIISAQGHGDISIWDIPTGQKLRILQRHEGQVDWLRLLPDGRTLVSVGDDGTLKTWDCATGALLSTWSITPGFVTAKGDHLISIDPESRHAIQIWSIASRKELQTLNYRSLAEKN
jgi:WD40 repeat protein